MAGSGARAVLFDMDGVLVDSYEAWFGLVAQAARDLGSAPVTREAFAAAWGQGVDRDVLTFFPGRSMAYVEAYYAAHFGEHARAVRVDPAAEHVLAELGRRGIASAVITNTPSDLARQILAAAALAPDVLVGASDVARAKPAPDMVVRALALLKQPPTAALMLGDSRFDREAAGAAGVRFVGFRTAGESRIEELAEILALAD